jgi:hypothetical protein
MKADKGPVRVIAFYLPQFHPIPENDEWWSKGFTEWTNVTKAKPLFRGHVQPHLPSELGFCDLRVPETRIAQADLAREYGIEGFCYWHYWFAGKRLIERPFQEVLASGAPDFPFCLAWANQSWTGIWHGEPGRKLVEQTYPGDADFEEHFNAVLPAFRDPRYIRVDGKPLFLVYDPQDLPDARKFTDLWRNLARRAGLEGLYLIGSTDPKGNPGDKGFDAAIPDHPLRCIEKIRSPFGRFTNKLCVSLTGRTRRQLRSAIAPAPRVCRYADYVKWSLTEEPCRPDWHPVVLPNWDNTPRSGVRGVVLQGSTPELFGLHLREGISRAVQDDPERRIVFVKSWNEWAEGNYMEPDTEFGSAYLRVLRDEVTHCQKACAQLPG